VEAITAAQNQNFGEVFYTVFDTKPHSGTFNGKNPKFLLKGETVYVSQFSEFPQFNDIIKGSGSHFSRSSSQLSDIITC